MHNDDDKYPARLGFEPGTSRSQAPVDTNQPSGPAGITIVKMHCPARNVIRWWLDVGPAS